MSPLGWKGHSMSRPREKGLPMPRFRGAEGPFHEKSLQERPRRGKGPSTAKHPGKVSPEGRTMSKEAPEGRVMLRPWGLKGPQQSDRGRRRRL